VVGYQEKDDLHLYQQGEIIFQIIPNNIIEEKEVDFFFQKRYVHPLVGRKSGTLTSCFKTKRSAVNFFR
jgi:hypothetical protein